MDTRVTAWRGEPVVGMSGGGYEAVILPRFGANCVALRHLASGAELLRTPPHVHDLRDAPNVYGLPPLFPPNRIRGGRYAFQGRDYVFPINEPARGHHIHGILSSAPFRHLGGGEFEYRATPDNPYLSFPHAFTFRRTYALDEDGLSYSLELRNDSPLDMPAGVGIHAAWNTNFFSEAPAGACRLRIPVLRQWVLDPVSIIPTGETISDSALLTNLREGRLEPEKHRLSCLLEIKGREARLTGENGHLDFEFDRDIRFLMLWNNGGGSGFLCVEPQNWLVDAPNLRLEPEASGFQYLRPGQSQSWQFRNRYTPADTHG